MYIWQTLIDYTYIVRMGKGEGNGEGWGEGEGKGQGNGGTWKGDLCSSCDMGMKCKYLNGI